MDLKGRVLPLLEELERLLDSRKEAVEVAAKGGALLAVSAQLLRSNFQAVLAEGLSEQQARILLQKAPAIFTWDWSDASCPPSWSTTSTSWASPGWTCCLSMAVI
jgi:hypothetical protein